MSQRYAKDQPTGFVNRIEKVAIIGGAGRIGGEFTKALLETGKHTVTLLSRPDSKSELPAGANVVRVDYNDIDAVAAALKGQQFFVITLSVFAPPDTHSKLVQAAAKAGVPYVMPNAYGPSDFLNEKLCAEMQVGDPAKMIKQMEEMGLNWIALTCGFWYEWSLALPSPWFGFDIKARKVTFYDDGKLPINVSTWRQCGLALAGLLNLKELPEDKDDKSPTVSNWKNRCLYTDSFKVSQRDMLDSLHRVLGTTDKDWEIDSEPVKQRFQNGLDEMKAGNFQGRAKAMYARVFFKNEDGHADGDYESRRGLDNDKIGLKKDDLDAATKKTVEMVESGWNPFGPSGH